MKKFIIYNTVHSRFTIHSNAKDVNEAVGIPIAEAAKKAAIKVRGLIVGYAEVPKDTRGGKNGQKGFRKD